MRYPGGKGKCYHHIINILPPHRAYIETHLGGGSVLRQKKPATVNIGVDRDPAVIRWWQELFPTLAKYVEADAVDFLASQHFLGDELVYCDPPYLPSTRRRNPVYRHDYSEPDHIRLLDALTELPCMVVISGYPSELYDARLRDWSTKTFTARTHHGIRDEKVWFNFETPDWLHDGRHLGRNYRERQTIKRRVVRLQKRITALSLHEQCALFGALDDSWGEKRKQRDEVSTRGMQRLMGQWSMLPHTAVTVTAERLKKLPTASARPVQLPLFGALDSEAITELASPPEKKGPQRAEPVFNLGNQRKVC